MLISQGFCVFDSVDSTVDTGYGIKFLPQGLHIKFVDTGYGIKLESTLNQTLLIQANGIKLLANESKTCKCNPWGANTAAASSLPIYVLF